MVDNHHHEDRYLRSRGGEGGPEITMLTPFLISNQEEEGEGEHSNSSILAMMGDNEEDQQQQREKQRVVTAGLWFGRNHLYRAAAVVRHVWHHNYDRSSTTDRVYLLGGQWILPLLMLPTGLVLEATVLHWQVLWIRYAFLLPSSSSSSNDDDDNNNTTTSSDVRRRQQQRRIAGCLGAALLIHLPALFRRWGHSTEYRIYHGGEDYEYCAVVVLWANAILFLLVLGGQLEYAMPTLFLLLTPFWCTYLVGYVFISIASNCCCCGSCNIAVLFQNLEDAHYQGARFAADEVQEQETLRRQLASLAHLETARRQALRTQPRWHITLMKDCHLLARLAIGLVILFLGLQYGTSLYMYGLKIEDVIRKYAEGNNDDGW
jgi:hypothetical protein